MVVVHPPAGRKPEVLRVVRLAFAVLASLVLSSVASAAERSPGTCLTLEGVWLAPWTDALDPACGADCGADDSEDDPLCTDEACFIEGVVTAPRMPAPSGPRCLEPGPSCGGHHRRVQRLPVPLLRASTRRWRRSRTGPTATRSASSSSTTPCPSTRTRPAPSQATAAGKQGKFWEMHDKLFENQRALKPEDLEK
jgi:hypothetical protein